MHARFSSELSFDEASITSLLVQLLTAVEIDGLFVNVTVTQSDCFPSFATPAVLVGTLDVVVAQDVLALLDVVTTLTIDATDTESLVTVFGLLSCELDMDDLELDIVTLVWL